MDSSLFEVLSFLSLPFMLCLVLAGIHCHLGFHVLKRSVIFVDLSLAQVAAFGTALALLLGYEYDDNASYLISLVATFAAATLFALARKMEDRLPQEAIIAITYALGSAALILILDNVAHGSEHIKSMLIGKILWVQWHELSKILILYSIVAVIFYIFRKQFKSASEGSMGAKQWLWDFAFYALFGIVITSSVRIAGVLQVFAYLIVPSTLANMMLKKESQKLPFAWGLAFILSTTGMIWSYMSDLPSGAAIVVCFSIVPVLLVLVRAIGGFKH